MAKRRKPACLPHGQQVHHCGEDYDHQKGIEQSHDDESFVLRQLLDVLNLLL